MRMNAMLSMRDLQKISTRTIAAIPFVAPVMSGKKAVAMLVPVHDWNDEGNENRLDRIIRLGDLADAAATAEARAKIAAYLASDDV